ncbi:unnamed protein product, partial [Staurois parvus]
MVLAAGRYSGLSLAVSGGHNRSLPQHTVRAPWERAAPQFGACCVQRTQQNTDRCMGPLSENWPGQEGG